MTSIGKFRGPLVLFFFLSSILFLAAGPQIALAQDVVVSAAVPDNAPQGSVNMVVQVKGNGFKKGAIAKWLVTGSETDTGGVTVNATTYVSPTELRANITVAVDAQTQKKFDIKVTLTSGRTGKGIELFSVAVNPPDPAIAYVGTSTDLWVMDDDGLNQRELLSGLDVAAYDPSWSPDGTQVVFGSDYDGNGIYLVNKDGTGLRKILATNGHGMHPVWSPVPALDGKEKIAFYDLPPGRNDLDLYLVNVDGTGLVNLTNTIGPGEFRPAWNSDATRLAAHVYPCEGGEACWNHDIIVFDLELRQDGTVGVRSSQNITIAGPLRDANPRDPDWARTQD